MNLTKKRGRPSRCPVDSARTAYWANNLSFITCKPLSEVERFVYPNRAKKRDGGGFEQPNAFIKYGKGQRIPKCPLLDKDSVIELTNKVFPNSDRVFNSPLWPILKENGLCTGLHDCYKQTSAMALKKLQVAGVNSITNDNSEFTDNEFVSMVKIYDIDVLALMICQMRNNPNSIRAFHVFYIRNWIAFACSHSKLFIKCKELMLKALQEKVPELGELMCIEISDLNKSNSQANFDTKFAVLATGKSFEFEMNLDLFPCFK